MKFEKLIGNFESKLHKLVHESAVKRLSLRRHMPASGVYLFSEGGCLLDEIMA